MATAAVTTEYCNLSLQELRESPTNPRQHFEENALKELSESIKAQGVLSPILVRPLPESFPEHFEIVTGARRFRAAQLAGLDSVPVRIVSLSDIDALEIQVIENLHRSELHPLDEARGFRQLLQLDGAGYDIHKIGAKIAKSPNYVATRLKLTERVPEVAEAFLKNELTVGHALLIAKLPEALQKEAFNQSYVTAWSEGKHDRVLKPIASLQAWVEQHVFLQLDKVPFPKDDATLVQEAGSCLECPKRTGFNKLLFPDTSSDQCTDPNCFNRKLDKFVARQVESSPKLVQISTAWAKPQSEAVLGRGRYVPIVPATERKNGKQTRSEHVNCKSAAKAIVVDGIEKGQTVRVCADPKCTTHFPPEPRTRTKQREAVRAQIRQRNEAEQRLFALRNRALSEVLKKVSAPFNHAALQLVAYLAVKGVFGKDSDFVFPSFRLKGKKPLSASIMVQKYLRPAAIKAGVLKDGKGVRFGFHNFRHSLASALVKLKCDPKTVQGILRHEDVRTTMQLYVQSDQESKLEAQGKFLELLLGDKAHLLTETIQ